MSAKAWVVQSVSDPQGIQIVAAAGQVTGFLVTVNVNLGDRGLQDMVDLWPLMSASQKATIQGIYQTVKNALSSIYGV
jgi:hypothetical protein